MWKKIPLNIHPRNKWIKFWPNLITLSSGCPKVFGIHIPVREHFSILKHFTYPNIPINLDFHLFMKHKVSIKQISKATLNKNENYEVPLRQFLTNNAPKPHSVYFTKSICVPNLREGYQEENLYQIVHCQIP